MLRTTRPTTLRPSVSSTTTGCMQRRAVEPSVLRTDASLPRGLFSPASTSSSTSSSSPSTSSSGRPSVACAAAAPSVSYYPSPDNKFGVFIARVRAIIFYLWTFVLAVPLFVIMCAMAPFVLLTDKYKRSAQHFVNNLWAIASTAPFYRITIKGKEHLPPPSQAVVYVANHQSFMDIYSLFHLMRQFKFISKTSNFLIPIVGWSMFLTGHVPIQRMDVRSQMQCLQTCTELLKQGCSVLFFPEGTRSKDGKMADFKKGAFSVAAKIGVPVVPITLEGTGCLMPNQREGEFWARSEGVTITIHEPMVSKNADELCSKAREVIAKDLPEELR